MTPLIVKNLPDHLHKQLRRQAENNHRSVTREVVSLIEAGVASQGARMPLTPPLKPGRGRGLTAEELEAAMTDNRYSHYTALDELNRYMDELMGNRDEVPRPGTSRSGDEP